MGSIAEMTSLSCSKLVAHAWLVGVHWREDAQTLLTLARLSLGSAPGMIGKTILSHPEAVFFPPKNTHPSKDVPLYRNFAELQERSAPQVGTFNLRKNNDKPKNVSNNTEHAEDHDDDNDDCFGLFQHQCNGHLEEL